jgi:hypothetical protein
VALVEEDLGFLDVGERSEPATLKPASQKLPFPCNCIDRAAYRDRFGFLAFTMLSADHRASCMPRQATDGRYPVIANYNKPTQSSLLLSFFHPFLPSSIFGGGYLPVPLKYISYMQHALNIARQITEPKFQFRVVG